MSATNPNTIGQIPQTPIEIKIKLIDEARAVLLGNRTLNSDQLRDMHKKLEHFNQFAYATEILLVKMRTDEENCKTIKLEDYQKLALYIYKDHSLPSMFKFKKALQELQSHDDLAKTMNCESLGLAGAIYKRKWQFDHQFKNLILSRYYYKRGFASWKQYLLKEEKPAEDIQSDDGYTAINYAYINELMAVDKLEEHGEVTGLSESIDSRLLVAEDVRKFILNQFIIDTSSANPELKRGNYPNWVLATIAEAFFGLRKYEQALVFIQKYISCAKNHPWEIRTFTQQLFSLAYLQERLKIFSKNHKYALSQSPVNLDRIASEIDVDKIYKCLVPFAEKINVKSGTPDNTAIIPEIKKGGKTGLALSGGGFRASLFHIGVLAALAEKDELRNIEVLSCVSGGSIIGAYYYIKLKKLLETKVDHEIIKADYIKIVQEIEKDFVEGVQKNLRVRIFSNLGCNIKMLFNKDYSRTHRLGELYEEHLYKKIWENEGELYMCNLFITPKDADESFDIATDNWKRENKIPQLVLNATSVNTGHNWQFTASWMGEPPGNIQADIDVKPRLRRMYYKEAPPQYWKFRLGYAVGASSCVPVMFHPMPMLDLYPGIDLQLIDGGLHDNQGIAALIEQECSNMIISDASGQLPTSKVSAANEAALFYRADNILQERLRELQFMDVKERNYTSQLNQLITLHLKNDLQQKPVSWKDCIDPPRSVVYENLYQDNRQLTKYGVLINVQELLSKIRTDLDSFSDYEAHSLMYSGYLQAHYEWNRQCNTKNIEMAEGLWKFSVMKSFMQIPKEAEEIHKVLETGSRQFLKLPYLNKTVKVFSIVVIVALIIVLALLIYKYWETPIINFTVKGIVIMVGLFFLGKLFKGIGFLFNWGGEVRKWIILLGLSIFGFIASNFYLIILNPLYNKAGKLNKLGTLHNKVTNHQ